MRTAIRLDEGLVDMVKQLAAGYGAMPTAIIGKSLRERPARSRDVPPGPRTRPSTAGEGGVLPDIELDEAASLRDIMDDRR